MASAQSDARAQEVQHARPKARGACPTLINFQLFIEPSRSR